MKSIKSITLLLFMVVSISGCVRMRHISFVEGIADKTKLINNGVTLYNDDYSGKYINKGEVSGTFCHRSAYYEYISLNEVKNNLMKNAKAKNMDAVMNVKCTIDEKNNWAKNCGATAICKGIGIQISEQQSN